MQDSSVALSLPAYSKQCQLVLDTRSIQSCCDLSRTNVLISEPGEYLFSCIESARHLDAWSYTKFLPLIFAWKVTFAVISLATAIGRNLYPLMVATIIYNPPDLPLLLSKQTTSKPNGGFPPWYNPCFASRIFLLRLRLAMLVVSIFDPTVFAVLENIEPGSTAFKLPLR